MTLHLDIGPTAILAYRRLAYSPWHALAEFVDNSTQSFTNNEQVLSAIYKKAKEPDQKQLTVSIVYDANASTLTIEDNAMGMDLSELTNALKIAYAPAVTDGRSQYGLGLKTAACWLGDFWRVNTRKLGSDLEHEVSVDVTAVSGGSARKPFALPHVAKKHKDGNESHFTKITIERLHQRFAARTLGKIKEFLGSMYRNDLQAGTLRLKWQGECLVFDPFKDFARPKGKGKRPYKRKFDFQVVGHDKKPRRVWGWYGILGDKKRGRANAGFVVLRRGRALRTHPEQWRPVVVFGEERNDLINQRITGEINLDDFEVSHTKDWIQWQGEEQVTVEKYLKVEMADYLKIARGMRVKKKTGPTSDSVQKAVDLFSAEWTSLEFDTIMTQGDVPEVDVVSLTTRSLLLAVKGTKPRASHRLGKTEFSLHIAFDASSKDPYYAYEVDGHRLRIAINANHPHWAQLRDKDGVLNFLRHCAYDAVSEWKCLQRKAPLVPATVRFIKDGLLRLPSDTMDDLMIAEEGEDGEVDDDDDDGRSDG
jgi:hypothetical protein